jgi:hypothetical protein
MCQRLWYTQSKWKQKVSKFVHSGQKYRFYTGRYIASRLNKLIINFFKLEKFFFKGGIPFGQITEVCGAAGIFLLL